MKGINWSILIGIALVMLGAIVIDPQKKIYFIAWGCGMLSALWISHDSHQE